MYPIPLRRSRRLTCRRARYLPVRKEGYEILMPTAPTVSVGYRLLADLELGDLAEVWRRLYPNDSPTRVIRRDRDSGRALGIRFLPATHELARFAGWLLSGVVEHDGTERTASQWCAGWHLVNGPALSAREVASLLVVALDEALAVLPAPDDRRHLSSDELDACERFEPLAAALRAVRAHFASSKFFTTLFALAPLLRAEEVAEDELLAWLRSAALADSWPHLVPQAVVLKAYAESGGRLGKKAVSARLKALLGEPRGPFKRWEISRLAHCSSFVGPGHLVRGFVIPERCSAVPDFQSCIACKTTQPIENFPFERRTADGKSIEPEDRKPIKVCKPCCHAYHADAGWPVPLPFAAS